MAALGATVIGIATWRGGGDGGSNAAAAPTVPACAHAGKSVARPDAAPAELFPSGTAITSSTNLPGGKTLVTGVVRLDFRSAVQFYVVNLPHAGYQLSGGDAEQDEAEAFFLGKGVRGKWKVNGILNCPRAVTVTLLVGT